MQKFEFRSGAKARFEVINKWAVCIVAISLVLLVSTALFAKGAASIFVGVGLKIPNETVPAGGMLQMKVLITEPKPILKGGQRTSFSSPMLKAPVGIHLFSPAGDAAGVAILSSGTAQFYLSSPLLSLGTDSDYPLITMAIPVTSAAVAGQESALTLSSVNSSWFNPSAQPYPLELKSGTLTIGGSLSITDIVPGSGIVPAGAAISIKGIGFQPNAVVQVKNSIVATTVFVNSGLIQVTLAAATDMENRQVRVTNPGTNGTTTYFSYQRTNAIGASAHTLVAASHPLFARTRFTVAYLKPLVSGTAFTALALQNPGATSTVARLELRSLQGTLLATQLVPLAGDSRMVRDVREFFPTAAQWTGTEIKVASAIHLQVLGMAGDDASGIVLPVLPSTLP